MADTNNILKVENLKIIFFTRKGKVYAVDDISFSLKKRETIGLVGESGCGKTTTVLGLMKMVPTPGEIISGRILIDGKDIIPLSENEMRKKMRWVKISMVFQGAMNCFTPVYTIGKQMMETIQAHKEMVYSQVKKKMIHYLNLVGLPEDIIRRYRQELSGGM
jgi:peptide/nickel transport system ATP-binding protein